MASAGSITVAVRVRPPSSWEAARLPEPCYDTTIRGDGTLATSNRSTSSMSSVRDIVQVVDDRILTFDPAETDRAKAFVERGFVPPGTKRYKDKRFMFDRVFRQESSQQEVFDGTARPLLNNLLDGYNATVFAYGATGCGKTHTISGTDTDPGIIYLLMADLFQRIGDRKDDYHVEVCVTFLEIYNEEIRDLLAEPEGAVPRGGLQIREDKSVKVVGLTELKPATAEEVKEIVLLGNSRRTQSPTHANETSSRSHAVLQVHVTQAPRTASITEERTAATLSIIDLAGSERAAATTNMGKRMVEGANINKSLLALGNCINALCESGGAVRHIPYRNSKLTRLLKFSLGGNCKTVMIVCIAPTSIHFDDTHNTLLYAERATKIKTRVVTRNVLNVDRHVGQYVEAINRLNIEVAELKAKLAGKINSDAEVVRRKKAEAQAEVDRAKHDIQTRAEQTQASITDGAMCSGKLASANIKLSAIRARLNQLDQLASTSQLSSDLEAERGLLRSLAIPEEEATRTDSALNQRLLRSNNSSSMFEAMLRAVAERRSDRLDEVSIDNVRLDAQYRKAEMEKIKAEAERDSVKDAMKSQSEMLVNLLGMVGRYTVVVRDASRSLRTALEEGRDGLEGTVRAVSSALKDLSEQNDGDFRSMVGHSTSAYVLGPEATSTLDSFKGHVRIGAPRMSTATAPVTQPPKFNNASRRSSSYGALGIASPARKAHIKSPRKSLRNSLSGGRQSLSGIGAPYRRPVDKKEKKGVQWRDQAGQGELVDNKSFNGPLSVSMLGSSSKPSPSSARTPDEADVFSASSRPGSRAGTESDWEDERTEDSVNWSFASLPPRDMRPMRASTGSLRPRRQSRLDSSFLKVRGASTLGSLAEDDETAEGLVSPRKRQGPLLARSLNDQAEEASTSSSEGAAGGALHMPKGTRERINHISPRRPPPTPRAVGGGVVKPARRRSNIGPMRSEKARRRPSQIPQLSPKNREDALANKTSVGGPKRVSMMGEADMSVRKSPSRKRVSLLTMASRGMKAGRPSRLSGNTSVSNLSLGDVSSSAETSFKSGPKPTWK